MIIINYCSNVKELRITNFDYAHNRRDCFINHGNHHNNWEQQ